MPACAGLHVTTRLRADAEVDIDQMVARARSANVHVESLAAYYATSPPVAGLVIGYGALSSAQIRPGLERLATRLPDRSNSGTPTEGSSLRR